MSWAAEELRDVNLGDVRRNRRLVKIVEDLASSPESSVPLASRDAAALQGTYDFWSNPRVKAESILAAHQKRTVERLECLPLVLAIQDTTELDYSTHASTQGLGYLRGAATKGLLLHSTLCVSEYGEPLGVLDQQMWARSGNRSKSKQRTISEKESGRWIESLNLTQEVIPSGTQVVTIADREADMYELLGMPRRQGCEYLIRVYRERQVRVEPEGESQSLKQMLQNTPAQGYLGIKLQRTPRRESREARLSVRWVSVWLQPPSDHPQREQLAPIRVQVLWAIEEEGPLKQPRISWILVTTLPLVSWEQACQYLRWYSYRWLIERYHFVLKSGCLVERLQLQTAARLKRAISTLTIVAWRLLSLTYSARCVPDLSADFVFEDEEWQTLSVVVEGGESVPERAPPLSQCIRWLAQLGGFVGRKGDGEPGAKTIWRGLRRLRDLLRSPLGVAAAAAT